MNHVFVFTSTIKIVSSFCDSFCRPIFLTNKNGILKYRVDLFISQRLLIFHYIHYIYLNGFGMKGWFVGYYLNSHTFGHIAIRGLHLKRYGIANMIMRAIFYSDKKGLHMMIGTSLAVLLFCPS